MPLLAGFVLSRIVADPLFVIVESKAPMAFAPTDAQKVSAPPVHTGRAQKTPRVLRRRRVVAGLDHTLTVRHIGKVRPCCRAAPSMMLVMSLTVLLCCFTP